MEKKAFPLSPLITPIRLTHDIASVFNDYCKPAWVLSLEVLDDDASCHLTIKGHPTKTVIIDRIILAAIYELTRFRQRGGGVVFNATKKFWYLKVTFAKHNFTVGRVVLSAGQGAAVVAAEGPINTGKDLPLILPKYDLRPENQFTQCAGQAYLAAREKALAYTLDYARKNATKGYDVEGYIANLRALFDAHDARYSTLSPS